MGINETRNKAGELVKISLTEDTARRFSYGIQSDKDIADGIQAWHIALEAAQRTGTTLTQQHAVSLKAGVAIVFPSVK